MAGKRSTRAAGPLADKLISIAKGSGLKVERRRGYTRITGARPGMSMGVPATLDTVDRFTIVGFIPPPGVEYRVMWADKPGIGVPSFLVSSRQQPDRFMDAFVKALGCMVYKS